MNIKYCETSNTYYDNLNGFWSPITNEKAIDCINRLKMKPTSSSDGNIIIFTSEASEPLNPLGTFGDPEQGKKSDDNKPPMELLPSNGLIEVAKAMGYGAKKYNESWPDMNWPKVKNAKRRYLGAALRHIMARLGGEVRDPESGELHVAHASFCLLALCEFDGGYRKESK